MQNKSKFQRMNARNDKQIARAHIFQSIKSSTKLNGKSKSLLFYLYTGVLHDLNNDSNNLYCLTDDHSIPP